MSLELKFDPKTIEHLGVKMYSTLPPALAELISNAYDADSSSVEIILHTKGGRPSSIIVQDDGDGMSAKDIQEKFLVIGRNRREDGDKPSRRFNRLATGKKGLGKLALFGLANKITINTVKDGLLNVFELDWDDLLSSGSVYNPNYTKENEETTRSNGTFIKLSGLKRKSAFDLDSLANSLAKIFIVSEDFSISIRHGDGKKIVIDNARRFSQIEKQFLWTQDDFDFSDRKYLKDVSFEFIAAKSPIPPHNGNRGVTIFSRGKMVNAPEYFTDSASSHFYQYLTGWVKADFIDLLSEDVISTNRQSINWDADEMIAFRAELAGLVRDVANQWRKKKQDLKNSLINERTGIDREKWTGTLPPDIRSSVDKILDSVAKSEDVTESASPIIMALHELIPEYPLLHWRHLDPRLQVRVKRYYEAGMYGNAADEAIKVYSQELRDISNQDKDGSDLASLFSFKISQDGGRVEKYPAIFVTDLNTVSARNIQDGHGHLTRGVMTGFRNPLAHAPMYKVVPETFSELDCLNVLSLVSYLISRVGEERK